MDTNKLRVAAVTASRAGCTDLEDLLMQAAQEIDRMSGVVSAQEDLGEALLELLNSPKSDCLTVVQQAMDAIPRGTLTFRIKTKEGVTRDFTQDEECSYLAMHQGLMGLLKASNRENERLETVAVAAQAEHNARFLANTSEADYLEAQRQGTPDSRARTAKAYAEAEDALSLASKETLVALKDAGYQVNPMGDT